MAYTQQWLFHRNSITEWLDTARALHPAKGSDAPDKTLVLLLRWQPRQLSVALGFTPGKQKYSFLLDSP